MISRLFSMLCMSTPNPTASCFHLFFSVDLNKASHFTVKEREKKNKQQPFFNGLSFIIRSLEGKYILQTERERKEAAVGPRAELNLIQSYQRLCLFFPLSLTYTDSLSISPPAYLLSFSPSLSLSVSPFSVWLPFQIYPNYRKKKLGEVQQPGVVGAFS